MTTPTIYNPILMLVEDDQDDQELARLANQKLDAPFRLILAEDGAEALDYLRASHTGQPDTHEPAPNLLLVDLDMPRMDGLSFLKNLREDKALRHLPVVMFTTSKAQRDIAACYEHGCNSYVVKPMNISRLAELFDSLTQYWFRCVRLPA